jgi:hypothetical protein
MGNGSGVSRGDRNRNARLERLRALVPAANAIAGIDLAGVRQMVVVTDHDSRVIAAHLPVPGLGSGYGAGLGPRACDGERLGGGDGGVRADRAPVAGAGSAGRRPVDAVRVRAAAGDVMVAADRGSDVR